MLLADVVQGLVTVMSGLLAGPGRPAAGSLTVLHLASRGIAAADSR